MPRKQNVRKNIVCGNVTILHVSMKKEGLSGFRFPDGTTWNQHEFNGWALPFGLFTASAEVAMGAARMIYASTHRKSAIPEAKFEN